MTDSDVARLLRDRASHAGIELDDALAARLAEYLAVLARWSRRINLTALPIDPPSDQAIDRLILEPLVAARLIRPEDRLLIDVGSGGGSPAIPLKLAAPWISLVMVESRARKAAFLREATRRLGLAATRVEAMRIEDLARRVDRIQADVVTIRAVKFERELVEAILTILAQPGRVVLFGSSDQSNAMTGDTFLRPVSSLDLPGGSSATVLERVPNDHAAAGGLK